MPNYSVEQKLLEEEIDKTRKQLSVLFLTMEKVQDKLLEEPFFLRGSDAFRFFKDKMQFKEVEEHKLLSESEWMLKAVRNLNK